MEAKVPGRVSPLARACLDALGASGLGPHLSLGGAFGLAHYHEYRATDDVDAWWIGPPGAEERARVVATIEAALSPFGTVRTRAWGDVVSIDLAQGGKTVFSFQIARRSALLEEPGPSPWPGIKLDSLADLVASKMTALVERGAPRDFRDIHALCAARIVDVGRCWELWSLRRERAGEAPDRALAALAVRTHLARIEAARPLESIASPADREAAERVRAFLARDLLHGL